MEKKKNNIPAKKQRSGFSQEQKEKRTFSQQNDKKNSPQQREKATIPQPKETRLKVAEATDLMSFLLSKMGGMKRNSVKALLAHRQVLVNDEITTKYDLALSPGDKVTVSSVRGNSELLHPMMKIIFEDPHIIIVEKKEGLLTVKKETGNQITAFSILKKHVQKSSKHHRVYTANRLDRDSSGILVFAKNQEVNTAFHENWHRDVKKRIYVAVVEGQMKKEEDEIRRPSLTENSKKFPSGSDAKEVEYYEEDVTRYRVIKSNADYSLLEIELRAGEKNQIRAHLSAIGHPVLGDKKYGSKINPIKRMALHARIIEFRHPATKKMVQFETLVPRNFLHLFH